MPSIEERELERVRYEQGQVIRSRDFNDQAANEDQLRWWHNRSLHNAYGVVSGILNGFAVQLTDPATKEFTVRPGVAYDCFGRELILTRERKTRLPDEIAEGTAILLLQYQAPAVKAGQACNCPQAETTAHEPALRWVSGRVSVRDGVAIARVSDVGNLDSETVVDTDVPIVRALARPHMASGKTESDGGPWELWTQRTSAGEFFIGFQIRVDTSAAGFTRVPCYFAWAPTLLVESTEISGAEVNSFTFRLWLPTFTGFRLDNNPFLAFLLPSLLARTARQICWLGIESSSHEEAEAPAAKPIEIL
jgi:hypothetical protein